MRLSSTTISNLRKKARAHERERERKREREKEKEQEKETEREWLRERGERGGRARRHLRQRRGAAIHHRRVASQFALDPKVLGTNLCYIYSVCICTVWILRVGEGHYYYNR